MSNKKKLAISFVVFTLSVVATLLSAAFIFKYGGAAPKILGLVFILGCAGCAGSLIVVLAVVFIAIFQDRKKTKALRASGLMQVRAEDVIRIPVEDDDEEDVRQFEEHVEKFLGNIVYPQGFIDFLKKYTEKGGEETLEKAEPEPVTRYVEKGGEYYELAEIYTPDELIEINNNILYSADYYMQFRDILFFADDESGHCHFLLDYGKGGEPTVKYLDDELDVVRKLADNFSEFAAKVKECTYGQFSQLLEEYEKNKYKR